MALAVNRSGPAALVTGANGVSGSYMVERILAGSEFARCLGTSRRPPNADWVKKDLPAGALEAGGRLTWATADLAEESVEELATLFKELATLVVEQGTILDRIDHNMEQTVVVTKKGIEELETAEKYQKSARPIKCMLVLMVLIVVMTIVIVLRKTNTS